MGCMSDDKPPKETTRIEELLERPCWVIDLLPQRVPADAGGQFFRIEPKLLEGKRLRRSFVDVLLKLNCYYDFLVFRGESDEGVANPKPEKLEKWVLRDKEGLTILIPEVDALVAVPTDSTCIALHNPNDELLELVRQIVTGSGLFVWEASNS